jgi:DNA-binding MarR family transcriptional regulator
VPETTASAWWDELSVPGLMRRARGSYGNVVQELLADAGCDDVPRNGAFVIGGLDRTLPRPEPMGQAEAVMWLGVSRQASSQLIDTLVLRGYLEREPDPGDRRRMLVRLTERGCVAAVAVKTAVERIDAELAQRLSDAELRGLRKGLAALAEIKAAGHD